MQRSICLTALLLSFFVSGAFGQSDRRLPMNFSLQVNGQVRFGDSKIPAENVLVRIESFSGGLVAQVTTDRTGKFSFTGLQPQQYIVTVHHPGYIDMRETVELNTANSRYLNFLLVQDKTSLVNRRKIGDSTAPPSILAANIPAGAQEEYAKAESLLSEQRKEKTSDAIKHLEKAIAIYPDFLAAHLALGLANMDLQNWDNAERALLAAIKANSEASTAYYALGEVYRRKKNYAEAEKVLLTAIKLNAQYAEGHLTLAEVYWDKVPSVKDEQSFRATLQNSWNEVKRALELKPTLSKAHLLSGNLLLRARRAADALVHFEEYLKLEPKGEFAAEARTMIEKIKQALEQEKKKSGKTGTLL